MTVVTYDNPATCHRECWQDGRLICSYSMEVIIQRYIPAEYFFFSANIGDWKTGQFVGDLKAMEKTDESN